MRWQEQNCWRLNLGVLLTSVYLDFLSNTYEVSQLAKKGRKKLEGEDEDLERQQMDHTATDRKLMSRGRSWLLLPLLPADGSVLTGAPGWQSDT